MRFVGADELRGTLPMAAAVDALEAAFEEQDPTDAGPPRATMLTEGGSLLLMPARGTDGVGVKLVTLTDENPRRGLPLVQAMYALFDSITQEPLAVFDGTALTALRTAAVSGLATRRLALPEASTLVLFGAGVQAAAHLEAMCSVRPVRRVVIVSRTQERANTLVEAAQGRGLDASAGSPEDVPEADLVCTCTTSTEPLFEGAMLRAGTHVNAVGAYLPTARELDTEAIRRARVVVEARQVALAEAGDLIIPIEEGAFGPGHIVADLSELVRGAPARTSAEDVTVFKSVGMAFEDLVVAGAAWKALAR